MTEKQFKVTNISSNGMTGLFWLGKDKLSVYDVVNLLNELFEENKKLESELNRQTEITTNLEDFREFITEEQVKLNDDYNNLKKENEQLKNQNELLSDELEQCKAVIDYRWSEYLKKKEEQEND